MVFTIQYRELGFACLPAASPDPFPHQHHRSRLADTCLSSKHMLRNREGMWQERKGGKIGVTFTELDFSAVTAWQTTLRESLEGSENQTREGSLILTC